LRIKAYLRRRPTLIAHRNGGLYTCTKYQLGDLVYF
jgi:hypothetical protein